MHDLIIIGGGPAGLSAAITARARNKEVLVISGALEDNPLAVSKHVANYPGMPEATGLDILETMQAQAQALGAGFLQARAISILPMQASDTGRTIFAVSTSSDYVEARTIIIACGASSGGKPYKGELEYLGRGVSYCATCDGMLYRSSTVLVVGLSSEAAEEANFLAGLGAQVHYVSPQEPVGLDASIQQHTGKVLSIEGDAQGVTQVLLTDKKLDVEGVFILRPGIAPTSMLATLETEDGFIKVDGAMQTNVKGVFAAGDCTGKPLQIAKAVGEGQIAVLSAVEYLSHW